MPVADLAETIDELFSGGVASLGAGASVLALLRQLSRLEALATEAVGVLESSGEWATDGSKSASAWLAGHGHLKQSEARRHVARSRHLRQLPACREAWASGEMTGAHVDVLCRLDRAPTTDTLRRDEELLVGHAKALRFCDFSRACAYWDQFADPDGTEERAEARRARRNVTMTQSVFGTWLGTITLDPLSGTIVADELDRLERVAFEADWADARERLGREPRLDELDRSPGQRRADALVEMAARSKAAPEGGLAPQPLFSVLVDYPTLAGRICQLANGTVVAPGSLVPYLDETLVERAVFRPRARTEIGARVRFFTGATRRAVELRDLRCCHPTCDVAFPDCEVDHIVPVSQGGLTTPENGRLLCSFHNKLRNRMDDAAWGLAPDPHPDPRSHHDAGQPGDERPPP